MSDRSERWTDISIANQSIKTSDIKGKPYAEVNQRVKAFRYVYPEGRIETEVIHLEGDEGKRRILIRASVFDEEGKFLADGLAEEKESSTFINRTSFIENCQTSAIGRALGFCGFGIDTSIASAEEVKNAQNNQTYVDTLLATPEQVELIRQLYDAENIAKMLDYYSISDLTEMDKFDADTVIKRKL